MNNNTDNPNVIVRTELWYNIYNIIKQIPIDNNIDTDTMDAPSATTLIENLLQKYNE